MATIKFTIAVLRDSASDTGRYTTRFGQMSSIAKSVLGGEADSKRGNPPPSLLSHGPLAYPTCAALHSQVFFQRVYPLAGKVAPLPRQSTLVVPLW